MTVLANPGFERGDLGWTRGAGWSIVQDAANARNGNWCAKFSAAASSDVVSGTTFRVRPGDTISRVGGWFKAAAGSEGQARVALEWLDAAGAVIAQDTSATLLTPTGAYAESVGTDITAVARAKSVRVVGSVTGGAFTIAPTWYADDFSVVGDFIEALPATVRIVGGRISPIPVVSAFDPLGGSRSFATTNAGRSDRWSGVWTLEPVHEADGLREVASWIARVGRTGRFLAYDPLRRTPAGGVVSGLVVDGASQTGTTLAVRGGTASSTPLVAGDYVEVRDQYYVLVEPLELDTAGKGTMHIWPAIRTSPADGEDVITNQPSMVTRLTEVPDIRYDRPGLARISLAFEEAI